MAEGWPERIDGLEGQPGLVIKQVRTLDRAARGSEEVAALPIPRDILEQAHLIHERSCVGSDLELRIIEVTTDPAVTWCLPYSELPFDARFELVFPAGLDGGALEPGEAVVLSHIDALAEHPQQDEEGAWSLLLTLPQGAELTHEIERLEVHPNGDWIIEYSGLQATGSVTCERRPLLLSPEAYLETLISANGPEE